MKDRFEGWRHGLRVPRARVRGVPPSANGASSMHLWWKLPGRFVEVGAILEVVVPPSVPRLYFWALQVSFTDGGRPRGAAHLGLQAHPGHPGGTAVNWGGYQAGADGGGELAGSGSALPSALANPNTRDFSWSPGRRYRLRISAVDRGDAGRAPVRWRGEVRDETTGRTTVVRDLEAPAGFLSQPLVWSEVFARCDDPTTSVRWSDLWARDLRGEVVAPSALRTSYQSRRDGGCDNTTAVPDGPVAVLQVTTSPRRVPDQWAISWGR